MYTAETSARSAAVHCAADADTVVGERSTHSIGRRLGGRAGGNGWMLVEDGPLLVLH